MAAKFRKKKKRLLSVTVVIVAAALGAFIWLGTRDSGEPVNVYPFEHIGMTEFWGDSQESYGPVTTDKIQTEFLSDTQTVTEVAVKNGDQVKQGDILFSFDTTLDALSLERKRLEVEKVKAQIKAAEERLTEVRQLEPYVPTPEKAPDKDALGDELTAPYKISDKIGNDKITAYDGSKKDLALICWLKEGMAISNDILQDLYDTANYYQKNTPDEDVGGSEEDQTESNASAIPENAGEQYAGNGISDSSETAELRIKYVFSGKEPGQDEEFLEIGDQKYIFEINEFIARGGQETYWLTEARRVSDGELLSVGELEIPAYPQIPEAAQQEWKSLWGAGIELRYFRDITIDGKYEENDQLIDILEDKPIQFKVGQDAIVVIQSQIHNLPKEADLKFSITPSDSFFEISESGNQLFLMGTPEKVTTAPVEYTVTAEYSFDNGAWLVREDCQFSVSVVPEEQKDDPFYVVFKVTKDNYLKGAQTIWRGYKVTAYEDGSFAMLPYDVIGFEDHMLPEDKVEIKLPEIYPNQMYTADQIVDMQKQLYATIKEQTAKLRLVESEYAIMQRELSDGNVYAEIDGKVISLLTEEEARENKQPMVKVSGGGGFYIEGSVSELEKASLKIGQEVTVNDWNNGNMYTGEVVSVGDFPVENDNWNGIGNPTVSYYPFKAFVSEEADLEADSHVSISYSTAAAENGIYLDKAFVRTEHGSSFIYVRGADGNLEKRTVQLGKLLWGSYYEILSDLSEEDYLAFPYGKDVKHGAPTVESDISILYSY